MQQQVGRRSWQLRAMLPGWALCGPHSAAGIQLGEVASS
jgi:hypothetical protein